MTRSKPRVAFLGLGAMGARMAARLASDEVELRVWNRSGVPDSLRGISAECDSPAAAAKDAEVVISMVTDDDASREVWLGRGALRAMRRGAIAVECSTSSPSWVSELTSLAREFEVDFIDAPVVGSRPQAESGSLVFLAGGEESALSRLRPTLLRMGSAVHHLGASPAGAHAKLIVNALFAAQVAALAETIGLAARAQLDITSLLRALGETPVLSASAKGAAAGIIEGSFDPMFPLRLALKDLGYAMQQGNALGAELPVTNATRSVLQRASAEGLGEQNLTVVARLYTAA